VLHAFGIAAIFISSPRQGLASLGWSFHVFENWLRRKPKSGPIHDGPPTSCAPFALRRRAPHDQGRIAIRTSSDIQGVVLTALAAKGYRPVVLVSHVNSPVVPSTRHLKTSQFAFCSAGRKSVRGIRRPSPHGESFAEFLSPLEIPPWRYLLGDTSLVSPIYAVSSSRIEHQCSAGQSLQNRRFTKIVDHDFGGTPPNAAKACTWHARKCSIVWETVNSTNI
jgi:hypothetical protein